MFVRTKEGKILKCFKSESMNLPIYYVIGSKTNSYVEYQDVKKVSENIIDIVEVGDYVNGKLVIDVKTDYIFDYSEEVKIIYFSENDYIYSIADIKSIVTKEQFESMSYEVSK